MVVDFVYPRNKTELIVVTDEDKKFIESINSTAAKRFLKDESLKKIESLVSGDFDSLDTVLRSRVGIGGVRFTIKDNRLLGLGITNCKEIDFSELKADKLEWLEVQHTYYSCNRLVLPQAENIPNLKSLNLRTVNYTAIQEPLFTDYKNLTHLSLYDANAQELPDLELKELEELDISDNPLRKVPTLKTPKLKVLKVDSNDLDERASLSHLNQLKFIYLDSGPKRAYMITVSSNCNKILNHGDYRRYVLGKR